MELREDSAGVAGAGVGVDGDTTPDRDAELLDSDSEEERCRLVKLPEDRRPKAPASDCRAVAASVVIDSLEAIWPNTGSEAVTRAVPAAMGQPGGRVTSW